MSDLRIAIAGAGLGGLTAALSLAKLGYTPEVYERAPELGDVGAGISLSPNASKIFEHLGLGAFLEAEAEEPMVNFTRHYQSYEVLVQMIRDDTRNEYGAPYYQIHRAELHAALVAAVEDIRPGAVKTAKGVKTVNLDGAHPVLEFEDGSTIEADVVIGSDGIRSTLRKQLFADPEPRYTGHMAWRGLADGDKLPDTLTDKNSTVLIGPGQNFVRYPIRHAKLINYIGFARSDSWVEDGWNTPATREEVLEKFAGWHDSIATLVHATPEDRIIKWGLFGRDPLKTFVQGPVALIGDAAHPMLPFMGQGAAMAIEDGMVIARCIAESSSVDEALARYDTARVARTSMVMEESEKGGDRLQQAEPRKLADEPLRNEDTLGLFHYDATTIAI